MYKSRMRRLEERVNALENTLLPQPIKIEVSSMSVDETFSGEKQNEAVRVLTDPDYRADVGNIGDGIRIRRKNAKMTQEDLAGEIGISQPMLAQIERGSKVPSMILGRQIAKIFKCSMEELFEEA